MLLSTSEQAESVEGQEKRLRKLRMVILPGTGHADGGPGQDQSLSGNHQD